MTSSGTEKEPRSDKNALDSAWLSFRNNLDALRTFAREVGGFADQYDDGVIQQFKTSVLDIVKTYEEEVAHRPPLSLVDGTNPPPPTASESLFWSDDPVEDAKIAAGLNRLLADSSRRQKFMGALEAFARRHPSQGSVLRRGAVVTLMTYWEGLIADVANTFYRWLPEALPADQQNLTLEILRDLGSIQDAEAYVIEREVDGLLRGSLEEQLKYFSKRPSVDVGKLEPFRLRLVEIDQRRNLYVHNKGIVNRRYLSRVDPTLIGQLGVEDGKLLSASAAYLTAAIDLLEVAGLALEQLCWRQWRPNELGDADTQLVDALYRNLVEKRWASSIDLARFAEGMRLANDATRKLVIVNHCIALRDSGAADQIAGLLAGTDWSACSWRFRGAYHLLRGEEEIAFAAFRRAASAKEIAASDFAEWPLFNVVRGSAAFQQMVQESFPGSGTTEGPQPPTGA